MPARPVRRRAEPSAGPVIHDERLTPVPAPSPSPSPQRHGGMKRQTLDLPVADYHHLHDLVRDHGRDHDLRRSFNVQAVLRVLVERLIADPDLRAQVLTETARRSAT